MRLVSKVRQAMCLTLGEWLYRWLLPIITGSSWSSSIRGV